MNYRSSNATIRDATPGDLDAVTQVLSEAFLYGQIGAWLVAHLDTRHKVLRSYFAMLAGRALEHGQVEVTDDVTAVAVWYTIAGGRQPVISDYDTRLKAITGAAYGRFVELDEAMDEHHPSEPWHQHLAFLAVHPEHHRRGLGSALLHYHHPDLDQAGTPAFVHATGVRDRHLFTRHGYRPRQSYQLFPDGPRLFPLWRPPSPRPASAAS